MHKSQLSAKAIFELKLTIWDFQKTILILNTIGKEDRFR